MNTIKVFISHNSTDKKIASAFIELLQTISLGMISPFSSSELISENGIEYGDRWFETIDYKLKESDYVICLITPNSINNPWVSFEAGMAHINNSSKVTGILIKTKFSEIPGPFKIFQNLKITKEELSKLLIEILKLIKGLVPNIDLINNSIEKFLETIDSAEFINSNQKNENCASTTYIKFVSLNSSSKKYIPRLDEIVEVKSELNIYQSSNHNVGETIGSEAWANGKGITDMQVLSPFQPEQIFPSQFNKTLRERVAQKFQKKAKHKFILYKHYNFITTKEYDYGVSYSCKTSDNIIYIDFSSLKKDEFKLISNIKAVFQKNDLDICELELIELENNIYCLEKMNMNFGETIRIKLEIKKVANGYN